MSTPDIHPALLDEALPLPRRIPPIPRAARALIPELRHFPDEDSARRHFHEAWLLLRRTRFIERFHALDVLGALLAASASLTLIAVLLLVRSGALSIMVVTLGYLLWMGLARLVNLRKGYRIILREDLRTLGHPLCLACGMPLHQSNDTCDRCARPDHEDLLKGSIATGHLKRCPMLPHFTTLSGALRALHGAERGWKHTFPRWRRTRWIINAALAALIIVGVLFALLTDGMTLAVALAMAIPAHVALHARDRMLQIPFANEFIGARLARYGKLICTSCNYDIAALRDDSPNCPECGEPVPAAQQEAWRQHTASRAITADAPTPGAPAPAR